MTEEITAVSSPDIPVANEALQKKGAFESPAGVNYVLQLIGFAIGLTFIAAVILAYIRRKETQDPVELSHFRWQIRTFWFSALYMVIGALLAFFIVGYFIIVANYIWTLYRCIKGLMNYTSGKAMY